MVRKFSESSTFKAFFMLLILIAAIVLMPGIASAESFFSDVAEEYWGLENIEKAKEAGIIEGYEQPDGSWLFRPENYVTKQECITMLYRTLKLHVSEDESLALVEKHKDVLEASNIADWAQGYVAYFLEQGWTTAADFEESADDRSGGFVYAKRELIARWSALAMEYHIPSIYEIHFHDHTDIGTEYADYVHALYREGIMEGSARDGFTYFRPKSNVKRAEMAAVCTRLLGLEAREKHGEPRLVRYGWLSPITGSNDAGSAIPHGDISITDDKAHLWHIGSDTKIIVDGKTADETGISGLLNAPKAIPEAKCMFSTYIGGENCLVIQTVPQVLTGTLMSDEDLIAYRLLTIKLDDGTLVNYITDDKSKLPRRIVAGRDYAFIADGLTILELQ